MKRSTRLIVIAAAAAAFVPAAQARIDPQPDPAIDFPGARVDAAVAHTLPWVNTDIGSIETYPATWPDIIVHPVDLPAPVAQQKPSAAKQKAFWGSSSAPSRKSSLITDNSPSQNRLARRAAAQRATSGSALRSTLRTFPG